MSLKNRPFLSKTVQIEKKMKDRIHQLMESLHMTQKTFAEFLGISPASLSSIFNGRTNPSTGITMAIRSKIPDISLDWLMFGEGSMYKSAPQESQNALNTEVSAPEKGSRRPLWDAPDPSTARFCAPGDSSQGCSPSEGCEKSWQTE